MLRFGLFSLMLVFAVAITGCSQESKQKAGDALETTGEAVESVAEDAANVTKGAVDGVSEAAEENRAKSGNGPSD